MCYFRLTNTYLTYQILHLDESVLLLFLILEGIGSLIKFKGKSPGPHNKFIFDILILKQIISILKM